MSTLRQIEANRRNSQLSTGPRTQEGKSVSRFNALKSGINCKAQIIPGEDPADLQAMTDGYHHDCVPTTWMERALVDRLIRADWLLQRLSRLEAEMWIHEMESARSMTFSKLDEDAPLGDIYSRICDRFTRLQRRIDSTERSYYRALTQLQRLRSGTAPVADPIPADPDPLPNLDPSAGAQPLAPPPHPNPAPGSQPPAPELASFCQLPQMRSRCPQHHRQVPHDQPAIPVGDPADDMVLLQVHADAPQPQRKQLREHHSCRRSEMHQHFNERARLRRSQPEPHQRRQQIQDLQVYEDIDHRHAKSILLAGRLL